MYFLDLKSNVKNEYGNCYVGVFRKEINCLEQYIHFEENGIEIRVLFLVLSQYKNYKLDVMLF